MEQWITNATIIFIIIDHVHYVQSFTPRENNV